MHGIASVRALAAVILAVGLAGACDAQQIVFGETLSLSGPSAKIGSALKLGREACADLVNARGGISGRMVRIVTTDDGGSSDLAVLNAKQLVERDHAVLLLGPMGPSVNFAVLPWAEQEGVAVISPFGGDVGSRLARVGTTFFLTANQSAEAAALAKHVAALGLNRLALVRSADLGGQAAATAFEEGLSVVAIAPVSQLTARADGRDAQEVARAALDVHPQAVLLATTGAATAAMLRALSGTGGHLKLLQVYGLSSSASLRDLLDLGDLAQGYSMTQVLPSPRDGRTALVRDFQSAMKARGLTGSYVELEGCLSVLAAAEVLGNKARSVTRASVLHAFQSGGIVNVGGLSEDFSDHIGGARFTDIVFIGIGGQPGR
jgi:ABC-type branched-subunit amino acid transport system substrate-binding protein